MQAKPLSTYLTTVLLVVAISFNHFQACNAQTPSIIAPINQDGLREVRLGISNYYLLLPDKFEISEARGKEGQLGYNILLKDGSFTMYGLIEIRRGRPIGNNLDNETKADTCAQSFLDGKIVTWKLYRTETGFYTAFTSETGDLNARVSSSDRLGIDTLISIIATLTQK